MTKDLRHNALVNMAGIERIFITMNKNRLIHRDDPSIIIFYLLSILECQAHCDTRWMIEQCELRILINYF